MCKRAGSTWQHGRDVAMPGQACWSLLGGLRPPKPPRRPERTPGGHLAIGWGSHTHEHRAYGTAPGHACHSVGEPHPGHPLGGGGGGGAPPPANDMHGLVPYALMRMAGHMAHSRPCLSFAVGGAPAPQTPLSMNTGHTPEGTYSLHAVLAANFAVLIRMSPKTESLCTSVTWKIVRVASWAP